MPKLVINILILIGSQVLSSQIELSIVVWGDRKGELDGEWGTKCSRQT